MLDTGEDLGGLIVYTDAALHGTEIGISPQGSDEARSHKDVLERAAGERPAFTAVFGRLPSETYTLPSAGVPRARGVRIAGGAVAELDWSEAAPAAS